MDMPFLFRDLDHWNTVLSSDAFAPLEAELLEKADIKIIGYTGGGVRNLVSSAPIAQSGRTGRPQNARDGCPDPGADLSRLDRGTVGDCLQRSLQRHPVRRDRRL